MSKITSTWRISLDMQGLRADQYLKRYIGRISRQRAQKIISAQDFLLDDMAVKPSLRVKGGQKAILKRFAPDCEEDILDFKVKIIYEDEDILAVNKPAFLNIHPTANSLYKTLTFWLKTNYPNKKINPCHRIDKETSGIVVCAKNKKSESLIKTMFMNQKIDKTYLAVVNGHFQHSQIISLPLALQNDKGLVAIRMVHDPIFGKEAKTHVRKVKYFPDKDQTLVMCKPKTGRQHQIRSHLSLIGFPIMGDKLYFYDDIYFDQYCKNNFTLKKPSSYERHLLHAYKLKFSLLGEKYCIISSPEQ